MRIKFFTVFSVFLFLVSFQLSYAQLWRSSLYPENWTPNFTDSQGRFLHDFSYAGYKQGMEDIPTRTNNIVDVTKAPYSVDNTGLTDVTSKIQKALDDVGRAGGGVVYLPQGTYKVSVGDAVTSALRIMFDNVILRGDGSDKTFIFNSTTNFRGKQVIYITGSGSFPWETPVGSNIALQSDVPSRSVIIPLNNVSGLKKGELIIIATDFTTAFLQEIKADQFWPTTMNGQRYCRTITDIDLVAKTITIDIPTRFPIKVRDNARAYKVKPHLKECGIEFLSVGNLQNPKIVGVSDRDLEYLKEGTGEYEVHSTYLITLRNVMDCWVRNVNSYRPTANTYDIHSVSNGIQLVETKNVTIAYCNIAKPQYRGGSNGYTYMLRSNDCLVYYCRAERARHSYSFTGGAMSNGNVVSNCTGIDPRLPFDYHRHFTLVNLIDKYTSHGDYINADFSEGGDITGDMHAYTTTESVIWNTKSTKAHSVNFLIQSRQYGNGYVIGTSGVVNSVITKPVNGITTNKNYTYDTSPEDFVEGVGNGIYLIPQSLYADQLEKRKISTNIGDVSFPVKKLKIVKSSPGLIEFHFTTIGAYDRYMIYNLQGLILLSGAILQNESKLDIQTHNLKTGIYLIRLMYKKDKSDNYKFLLNSL